MNRPTLATAPVFFTSEPHEYTHITEGYKLTGVTTIMGQTLFPDKYAGIPEDVLKRAAQRGTQIHEACQLDDAIPTENPAFEEVRSYQRLKQKHGITMLCSEYLVADLENKIASKIDCVDTNLNLYDIKTTSVLDTEGVSWQLSFYAYFFDLMNPATPCGDLYAIWLRGDEYKLVKVHKHTAKEVQEVITLWTLGLQKVSADRSQHPAVVRALSLSERINELKQQLQALQKEQDDALQQLQPIMEQEGIRKIVTTRATITYTPASVVWRFDSKRFQSEHPEQYRQYETTTERKPSFRIPPIEL